MLSGVRDSYVLSERSHLYPAGAIQRGFFYVHKERVMAYDIDEFRESILEHLANEGSLVQWCKEPERPSYSTIMRWQDEDRGFGIECARAREVAAELSLHRHNSIIAGVLNQTIAPDVARVALSGLQWRAPKLAPRKYGDRVDLNHGGQENNPITIEVKRTIVDPDADNG